MRPKNRELNETFFIEDESCVFTYDGWTLQWRDNLVSVSNFVAIDFVHSGNCCSEKRSYLPPFRKVPHKCEGHDTMVVRYVESLKKNRLRLASVKIRGEGKPLTVWFRVLRRALETARKQRAKEYLVFINPFSGRQNGVDLYMKKVKPLFDAAKVGATTVITTGRLDYEKVINSGIEGYDAILAVGGDGTVSEIVNSLILSQMDTLCEENEVTVPKIDIPIGIIPCGSTDCVAYTLNGTRDIETNALHAILGNRTYFDVCRVMSETGKTRFFVSVFTYGYLSDLVKESEKFRWMGPIRYNYAGLTTLFRSKEYYGHVDMIGMQFGGKRSSATTAPKEKGSLSSLKKLTGKKPWSLSFTSVPLVPKVEPGSEYIETRTICRPTVKNEVMKCGGDVVEMKSNVSQCEEEEDGKNEDDSKRKPSTSEKAKAVISPFGKQMVPFRMELMPVTEPIPEEPTEEEFNIRGRFFLIACTNISCSSELTPNGIAPNCFPDDGNMNVILFRPKSLCDLYKMYARLTSRDSGSPLTELPFINIYRTKRVKISVTQKNLERRSFANCDGELFEECVVDIKIHESIVQFYSRRQN